MKHYRSIFLKRYFSYLLLFSVIHLLCPKVNAQIKLPNYPDSIFSTYYKQKASFAASLPLSRSDVVFIGNSITDGAIWSELFNDIHIRSRGFSGDITAGLMHRFADIVRRKPLKIFMLAGTNDLARGIAPDSVVRNICLMSDYLQQQSPATKLFVQSVLPVNDTFGKFPDHTQNGEKIIELNQMLESQASSHHYRYVALHDYFMNAEGKMNTRYTNDGLHLLGKGYALWKHLIFPLVYDLDEKPSLIPLPQSLKWNKGNFPLYACNDIVIKSQSLKDIAKVLQKKISVKGWQVAISNNNENSKPFIELQLGNVDVPQLADEAYQIKVTPQKVTIIGNTVQGIFYGIQSFDQLMRDGEMVDACEITDWPAFSWRGYMVDVGRNYEPMEMLKQQIDKMASYKLNIFHFHFTEDIAWRLASKAYPQLTSPENMVRDKGQYYTEQDMKELIRYCKERFITLVPEIDMPGHSAAFTRAMHVDMQSDSGIAILKNILKEFCLTYDLPYFHIGGDEVKIHNRNFIGIITKYLETYNKKTIGWEPGANFLPETIRQLWTGDEAASKKGADLKFIDSRHLYLNHMDPLEAPVTIFFREIGDVPGESKNMLGATLCIWPDRRVGEKSKIFSENPVYSGMLAFAERTWRGGGVRGWITNVSNESEEREYADFEQRLLDHKKLFFRNILFPYHRQMDMHWKLFGPYNNSGNLAKSFAPENIDFSGKPSLNVTGGTIVLRHWWYPMVQGVLKNPVENSTWYATTRIWSDEDTTAPFWIGFNDLSRSPATDTPEEGTWNDLQSKVWVNGKVVPPPHWRYAGRKGDAEAPLEDEGYSYREPTLIYLHKGWNDVLIKAPVGSFKGKDWQNPVKYEFTFLPVTKP